jgi:hypothetical protein
LDGCEVVALAVGRLALHYAEENHDEFVAALVDETEAGDAVRENSAAGSVIEDLERRCSGEQKKHQADRRMRSCDLRVTVARTL